MSCVGVQRSVETLDALLGPYNDLQLVKSVLSRRMGNSVRYVTLSDKEREITTSDIRSAFDAAVENFNPAGGVVREGQLLIYLSGHACRTEFNNFTRFLPSNLPPSHASKSEGGGIGTEELFNVRTRLQEVRQNHSPVPMAVFFDCCYSGAILESQAAALEYTSQHPACISIICSSLGSKLSHEQDLPSYLVDPKDECERSFGVFTWKYFEALEQHSDPIFASSLAQQMCYAAEQKRLQGTDVPAILDYEDFPRLKNKRPKQCFRFPGAPE